MKGREIVLAGLADAAAIGCGMLATVCAAPTAYGVGFSATLLAVFCAIGALLLSFWINVPKYGVVFGVLFFAAVVMIAAFQSRMIADGAIVFVCRIWDVLPYTLTQSFDVGDLMLRAETVADPTACVTSFLMMAAAATGLLMAPLTIRGRTAAAALFVPLPAIFLSFLYTDQQPALWALALLALFCAYALIGIGVRRGAPAHRGAFSVGVLAALIALLLLIPALRPQSRYEPIPEEERQSLFTDTFGEIADRVMSLFGHDSPNEYDLNAQGDRSENDKAVFRVRSTRSGTYLLRTHSYGAYENGRWKRAEAYDGEWRSMEALGMRQSNAVSILSVSESFSDERVVPYAFLADGVKTEETVVRSNGVTSYAWTFRQDYSITPGSATQEELAYYAYALNAYTMPDGAERDALLRLAQDAGIAASGDVYQTALNTAAFVRNSGTYTLTPGKMPRGEDFVLYFLTQSHSGYCIHFAGATTALLQAMGYPARFTIGYYADVPAGDAWYTVDERAAHAWTEVYVLGAGWVPIESTPGFRTDRSGAAPYGTQGGAQPTATAQPTHAALTPEPTPRQTPAPTEAPTPSLAGTDDPEKLPKTLPSAIPHGTENGAAPAQTQSGETAKRGLWWILIPLVPLAWAGAGLLIRKRRENLFRSANIKRAIPEMAHYLARLERFGLKKDPDAEEWALEAVFSDHRMKAQQKELLRRVQKAQRAVCANAPLKRFLLRWVLYLI